MPELADPVLRLFCTLLVQVGQPQEIGPGKFAMRRMVPITGGSVSGPEISGKILPGGADWQSTSEDGVTEFYARYMLETDDGALIDLIDTGIRRGPPEVMARLRSGEPVSPDEYYMRSSTRLETGHPDWSWINGMVFTSTGAREASQVRIQLYAVE